MILFSKLIIIQFVLICIIYESLQIVDSEVMNYLECICFASLYCFYVLLSE